MSLEIESPPSVTHRAGRSSTRAAWAGVAAAVALLPGIAAAHGAEAGRPGVGRLAREWDLDPFVIGVSLIVGWLYLAGVRRVNRLHPQSRFPVRRMAFFYLGMTVLLVALISPLARYDTLLFSVHMVQHMLLTLVAPPVLLLGTPLTLALRAATPSIRKGVLLPVLHSRVLRVVAFPVVAWLLFAAVMWGSHFSPLFDEALENAWAHRFEHFLYLGVGLLFWWQVIGVDPTPWRMNHPVRMLYLFLQMPQNSFLALAIYGSGTVIYDHYESTGRTWGPTPLADQQLAGIMMWVIGDLLFLAALGFVAYGWVQHEEREGKREDRRLERARERAQAGW